MPQLRGIGEKKVKEEVGGGKDTLTKCGVPSDDVVGLRAPFLNTDETVRGVLAGSGFLYERWVERWSLWVALRWCTVVAALRRVALRCAVLCCAVLRCAVLCCAVLAGSGFLYER